MSERINQDDGTFVGIYRLGYMSDGCSYESVVDPHAVEEPAILELRVGRVFYATEGKRLQPEHFGTEMPDGTFEIHTHPKNLSQALRFTELFETQYIYYRDNDSSPF